jgi:hypothetical protein
MVEDIRKNITIRTFKNNKYFLHVVRKLSNNIYFKTLYSDDDQKSKISVFCIYIILIHVIITYI